MGGGKRKSSRQPRPNKKYDSSSFDNGDMSIDAMLAKDASTKRKSNADINISSKHSKTTTTTICTSITSLEDKIMNKTLYNDVNARALNVTNVGDIGCKFRKEFDGELHEGIVVEIHCGKDRRCVYEDGDGEDLSVVELESLAMLHPSSNNTTNGNSNASNNTLRSSTSFHIPGLKFNNKIHDKIGNVVVGDNAKSDKDGSEKDTAENEVDNMNYSELVAAKNGNSNANNTGSTSSSAHAPVLKFNNKMGDKIGVVVGDSAKSDKHGGGEIDVAANEVVDNVNCSEFESATTSTLPNQLSLNKHADCCNNNIIAIKNDANIKATERSMNLSRTAAENIANKDAIVETVSTTMKKKDIFHSTSHKAKADASIATKIGQKDWSDEIKADEWATLSSDGKTVVCSACQGKNNARTNGVITMRIPFNEHKWNDHKKSKGHLQNAHARKLATLLDSNKKHKTHRDTQMTSFFPAASKKDKNPDTCSVASVRDSTTAIISIGNKSSKSLK